MLADMYERLNRGSSNNSNKNNSSSSSSKSGNYKIQIDTMNDGRDTRDERQLENAAQPNMHVEAVSRCGRCGQSSISGGGSRTKEEASE